jgi:hypothetical protein
MVPFISKSHYCDGAMAKILEKRFSERGYDSLFLLTHSFTLVLIICEMFEDNSAHKSTLIAESAVFSKNFSWDIGSEKV